MITNIHTYYNDTYFGLLDKDSNPSIPEVYLVSSLIDLGTITVNSLKNTNNKLKEYWQFRFYEGASLTDYKNNYSISKQVPMLDFSKVLLVGEYFQQNIGIRFFTSLAVDQVIVDIVSYNKKDKNQPWDDATLEKRFHDEIDKVLCPKNISLIVANAQKMSDTVVELDTFYLH